MSFQGITGGSLKNMIESVGEVNAPRVIREGIKSGKLPIDKLSIKEIWETTTGGRVENNMLVVTEAVSSGSFANITAEIINAAMIERYDSPSGISDKLVTTVPSTMQVERFGGLTATNTPEEVGEGMEYPQNSFTEKWTTVQNKKSGSILNITEETIIFDRTGQIIMAAQDIGEKNKQDKENEILRGVQDVDTPSVYRPAGIPTDFYSAGNANLITGTPFSEAGLESVRIQAHSMKDDSMGLGDNDYIFFDETQAILLVPLALEMEAWQLLNSVLTPESAENARNWFQGKYTILSSIHLDKNSTDTWYYGNFRRDFVYTEVIPLQTIAGPTLDIGFTRDIIQSFKTRRMGAVGCRDFRSSFQVTA